MADLGKAYVQIIPSAEGISGRIQSALGSEASSAGQSAGKSIGKQIGSFATKTVAALGVGKMIGDSLSKGMNFETSMAKVNTLFSGTSEEFSGLQNQILDISSATGVAASELAEAAYSAESASVPMGNLAGVLEGSAKLATAGFTDVDTALSAAVKTMNAYGLVTDDVSQTQANFEKVQKILIQTQNKGITTVGELGSYLAQVTPTAASAGVSFEQVGAALAGMTAQGIPTAQATTYLSGVISELSKEGTTASKILEQKTGRSFTQLMGQGFDLNDVLGIMTKDMDGFGEITKKTNEIVSQQEGDVKDWGAAFDEAIESMPNAKQQLIDMFGSIEAGKAALSITNSDWSGNMEAMATDADVVSEAYSKMSDTVSFKLGQVKTSLQNMGIEAFGAVADKLSAGLETISGVLSELQGPLGELGGAFMEAGGAAVNAIADFLGIEEGSSTVDTAVSVLKEVIGGLTDGLKFLADNMDTVAPVAAALAGGLLLLNSPIPKIASGIGGLVGKLSSIGDAATKAADPVSKAGGSFSTMAGQALKMIAAAAALLIAAVAIQMLVDAAIQIASAGTGAQIALAAIAGGILVLMGAAAALGGALTAGAVGIGVFGAAVLAIGAGIDLACDGISKVIDSITNFTSVITSNSESVNSIVSNMGTTVSGVFDTISDGVVKVIDSISGGISGVLDSVSGIIDSIGNAALNAGTGFDMLANAVINLTNTGIIDLAATLGTVADGIKKIASAASDASGAASNISSITSSFSPLQSAASSASSSFTTFTNSVKSAMTNMTSSVTSSLNTARSQMSSFASSVSSMASAARGAIDGMALGSAMSNQMASAYSSASGYIASLRSLFASTTFSFNQSIALPHFSMSGTFNAESGTVPSVSVSWYKKAAEYGALFSQPTIIGVGDAADPELLLGESKLKELLGSGREVVYNVTVNGAESPEAWASRFVRETNQLMRIS